MFDIIIVNCNVQLNTYPTCSTYSIFIIFSFAKQFGHDDWQANPSYIHRWTKRYGIVNKAVCSTKESAAGKDQLEEWKETILYPTLESYGLQDIYTVTKQHYSTSVFLIEHTARLVRNLLVLQSVRTD